MFSKIGRGIHNLSHTDTFLLFLFLSNAIEEMRETRGEKFCHPILAFHGTEVKNIEPICKTGFQIPGKIRPRFLSCCYMYVSGSLLG